MVTQDTGRGAEMARKEEVGVGVPEWVAELHKFLKEESAVGAVRLIPGAGKASLAGVEDGREMDAEEFDVLREKLQGILRVMDQKELGLVAQRGDGEKRMLAGETMLSHGSGEVLLEKASKGRTVCGMWCWRDFTWEGVEEEAAEGGEDGSEWKELLAQSMICLAGLFAGWLGSKLGWNAWVTYGAYGIALISGGWDAAIDTYHNLKQRKLDIHFLMLAVAAGAVLVGSWNEGALLLFLFSFSGAMEHYALNRTHREIGALTKNAPKRALLVKEGGVIEEVSVDEVAPEDRLRVMPGDVFPVDAVVIEGRSAADESALTGESVEVEKGPGDRVYSGTLNDWGMLEVKCLRGVGSSTLRRIIRLIRDAQSQRAASQRFTEKFGTGYTIFILSLTVAMFLAWWLIGGIAAFEMIEGGQTSAFYRAMTLLVVASPCALVLSVPSAILAAIARGARQGVLFRGGVSLEKLPGIRVVAMDKTGTLTRGEPQVVAVESFPEGFEAEIFHAALTLEQASDHPLARAIRKEGVVRGVESGKLDDFRSIVGMGVAGKVDGKDCLLGRRELLESARDGRWLEKLPEAPIATTEAWVVLPEMVGRIVLKDEIREESRGLIRELHELGLEVVMLTGDRRQAAEEVGKSLGVDQVLSGLKPEEKVKHVQELKTRGAIAMVGDGINDAPSLAAADVSVAMGGRGSDAAMEQSDIVLVDDRIEKLVGVFALGRKTRRVIRQNLVISLGTVVVMASCAMLGVIPLTVGVIMHEGSTVVVCLNSLRLLLGKGMPKRGGGGDGQ